uniref:Aminoacyl tRNA synthase complex-interacting multifunctional protein 1 isoform X1 n=1 Tax=Rhizophora mucronata TaxID=61149 RepID=A0A2P2L437_RHIMU
MVSRDGAVISALILQMNGKNMFLVSVYLEFLKSKKKG